MQILMNQKGWIQMSKSKFTLIGAYQFFNNAGDNLFKNLQLPEELDLDTLSNNILMKGGEFEVQYADPFFIQKAIQVWSNVYQETFTRWVNALAIEYAPLENYDRMEHWTDETDQTGSSSLDSTAGSNVNTELTKSAFDSSSYQPYENTHTVGTDTMDSDASMRNDTDSEHNGRVHGNIGVTTSQQMLNQELDLGYWNIYERITDLFLREFVIPVYE